jgi:hypothetical protein
MKSPKKWIREKIKDVRLGKVLKKLTWGDVLVLDDGPCEDAIEYGEKRLGLNEDTVGKVKYFKSFLDYDKEWINWFIACVIEYEPEGITGKDMLVLLSYYDPKDDDTSNNYIVVENIINSKRIPDKKKLCILRPILLRLDDLEEVYDLLVKGDYKEHVYGILMEWISENKDEVWGNDMYWILISDQILSSSQNVDLIKEMKYDPYRLLLAIEKSNLDGNDFHDLILWFKSNEEDFTLYKEDVMDILEEYKEKMSSEQIDEINALLDFTLA